MTIKELIKQLRVFKKKRRQVRIFSNARFLEIGNIQDMGDFIDINTETNKEERKYEGHRTG